jgi:SpoIID/LytB domain protein
MTSTRMSLRVAAATLAAVLPLSLGAPALAAGEFTILGRGNGHGIGMSQYGAQGQALEGRTASQILAHYFQGSSLGTKTVAFNPRIGTALDQTAVRLVVRGGTAAVTYAGTTATSSTGDVWTVWPKPHPTTAGAGTCDVTTPSGSTAKTTCPVFDPGSGASVEVYKNTSSGFVSYGTYGRDSIVELIPDAVGATWKLDTVVEIPLEQYLYGLAEMPYSWEPAALQAQAIAGRSYALFRLLGVGNDPAALTARGCSCHLYDSQQDQVYRGAERDSTPSWSRWKEAVDKTKNTVVTATGQTGTRSGVVQTFYSSSSNGRTESKHELWGGAVWPYLVSVEDRWSLDPTLNPWRAWEVKLSSTNIATALGMDHVSRIDVTARSTSGAATKVTFSGQDAGKSATVTRTGSWVRSTFGLRSTTINAIFLPPFTDDDGSIFESDIVWLADRGITRGCNDAGTLFCPDNSVTRGQMAAFLARALSLPPGNKTFTDARGHLFEKHIASIGSQGITEGCNPPTNDRYCPDQNVTRAEMATFLVRALRLAAASSADFTDTSSSVHRANIDALRAANITAGCNPPTNDRFCPNSDVTRAQMAAFLRRAPG